MGKINCIKILILMLFFVSSISSVLADYENPCCVHQFLSDFFTSPTTNLNPPYTVNCNLATTLLESCWHYEDQPVFDMSKLQYGCCCSGDLLIVPSAEEDQLVSELYCESPTFANLYSDLRFEQIPFGQTCADVCSETPDIPQEDLFTITGTIKGNYTKDSTLFNLTGGEIVAINLDKTKEIQDSTFLIGQDAKYEFSLPQGDYNFYIFINDHSKLQAPYNESVCADSYNALSIEENSNQNFVIQCSEGNQPGCTQVWEVESEGECIFYDNGCFKQVKYIDAFKCDPNYLERYESESCDCEFAYQTEDKCMIQMDADFNLDTPFEQCDRKCSELNEDGTCKTFEDVWKYIHPTDGVEVDNGQLTCNDFVGYIGTELVGCRDDCTYDLSNCKRECDPNACTAKWQCEKPCDACVNDPICEDDCESIRPNFLLKEGDKFSDLGLTEEGTNTNPLLDIFEYYDFLEPKIVDEQDQDYISLMPGIRFFEGTKDVELNWNYNLSCDNKLQYFVVSMCELSSEGECYPQKNITQRTRDKSYKFENKLEKGKTYCFDVCAVVAGRQICAINGKFKVQNPIGGGFTDDYKDGFCIQIPDEEYCMQDTHDLGYNCEFIDNYYNRVGCEYHSGFKTYPNLMFDNSNACEGGTICVESPFEADKVLNDPDNGARCVKSTECYLCNGLFGLFTNTVSFKLNINDKPLDCEDMQHTVGMSKEALNEKNVRLCYKDESFAISPQFNSCEAITSCYDYKSNYSCNNDPCFKFTDYDETSRQTFNNGCEWVPSNVYNELGVGVCRPINESLQECGMCDTSSPLGYCDEDMCENVYGKDGTCYFSQITNTQPSGTLQTNFLDKILARNQDRMPSCINKRDMACVLYTNETDCVGDHTLSVNLVYGDEENSNDFLTQRIVLKGNNSLTPSSDYMGLGVCEWDDVNKYCYKNANFNDEETYYSSTTHTDTNYDDIANKNKEDCFSFSGEQTTNILKCLIDNEPAYTNITWAEPLTSNQIYGNLPVYGATNFVNNLQFDIVDNMWNRGTDDNNRINLFVTFIRNNSDCQECINCRDSSCTLTEDKLIECNNTCGNVYPNILIENIDNSYFKEDGEYVMRYFSQDYGFNLEEVKENLIYIDANAPIISNIIKTEVINELTPGVYKTNLTISYETDEEAFCQSYLKRYSGTEDLNPDNLDGDIQIQFDDYFFSNYSLLGDGQYKYYIFCEDVFGNLADMYVYNLTIEGDKTIYDAQPFGLITTNFDTELSIKTIYPAECKYGLITTGSLPRYEQMTKFFTNHSYNKTTILENGFVQVEAEQIDSTYHNISLASALSSLGLSQDSKSYSFATACRMFNNNNITEGDPNDVISLTIDLNGPRTSIYSEDGSVYNEFNLRHQETRKLILNCTDLTAGEVVSQGCGKINYCLTENRFEVYNDVANLDINIDNAHTYCKDGTFSSASNVNSKTLDITSGVESGELSDCNNCYLIYYSEDKGGNKESTVKFTNVKVRDLDFAKATLYVGGETYYIN